MVHCEVLKVSEGKSCILFNYCDPITKVDIYDNSTVEHFINMRNVEQLRMYCDATFSSE